MSIAIPLSSITISDLERRLVTEALEQTFLSAASPPVAAFEQAMMAATERSAAVATNSGTAALELLLWGMGLGPGDEVVVPAFTFAAPALAVCRVGATPVFADVDPATWTLDPAAARAACTARTRAIVAVDVLGHPCDYEALAEIGLPLIEDAAEAFGARYRGRPAGAFGRAAVFSLHANKVVSSGEGGCIVTDDLALAARLRQLNAFGMDPARRYWHTELGCNAKMSGLVAAVALAQVQRSGALQAGRARVAARYDAAFAACPAVERRPVAPWATEAVWLYTIAVEDPAALAAYCAARGVDARTLWPVLPDSPALAIFDRAPCPVARRVVARSLWLPTWADMPDAAVDRVIATVLDGLANRADC